MTGYESCTHQSPRVIQGEMIKNNTEITWQGSFAGIFMRGKCNFKWKICAIVKRWIGWVKCTTLRRWDSQGNMNTIGSKLCARGRI